MRERIVIGEASVPRLASHARLQFDKRREQWVIQAPERLLVLDAIALDIVQHCTGEVSVQAIVDDLAVKYNAPRDVIAHDVAELLQGFIDKGVMTA